MTLLFLCLPTYPFCSAQIEEEFLTFQSYHLRNTSYNAVDAIDSDPLDASEQSHLQSFRREFTILDPIKSIHDSWEEGRVSTLTGMLYKLIPRQIDDAERVPTSVED